MNLHDIRQAQANFNLAEITNQRKSLHKLPQVFVKEFNPRFLAQMEIDQFVAGKGAASFCNRLERELDGLGRLLLLNGSFVIKRDYKKFKRGFNRVHRYKHFINRNLTH